jgi:hypothetical protein
MNIQASCIRKQARNSKSVYRAYIVLRVGMLSAATAWGVSSNQVEMCPQGQNSLYHPLDVTPRPVYANKVGADAELHINRLRDHLLARF